MENQEPEQQSPALEEARATIARLTQELASLQQQLEQEKFARELRQLLISFAAAGTILSPFTYTDLLELVVRAATQVISARSGSLFLIDEETRELVFEVALGPAAQQVKKFRVPLGHGFAGLTALTGQPMAVSNVQDDDRHAKDISSSVGYAPESILCVPLFYDDHIIGVLELLDKINGASFGLQDIETLGHFANIAAVAIAQSRVYQDQRTILHGLLRSFTNRDDESRAQLFQQADAFLHWMNTEDTLNAKARRLTLLVQELILSGEQNFDLCIDILQSFVTHINNRQKVYSL